MHAACIEQAKAKKKNKEAKLFMISRSEQKKQIATVVQEVHKIADELAKTVEITRKTPVCQMLASDGIMAVG